MGFYEQVSRSYCPRTFAEQIETCGVDVSTMQLAAYTKSNTLYFRSYVTNFDGLLPFLQVWGFATRPLKAALLELCMCIYPVESGRIKQLLRLKCVWSALVQIKKQQLLVYSKYPWKRRKTEQYSGGEGGGRGLWLTQVNCFCN